jgi:hypothetical protein
LIGWIMFGCGFLRLMSWFFILEMATKANSKSAHGRMGA